MENVRTVKVITYWDLVFFCHCLFVYGVSRRLGYPSGGLQRWRTNVWGGRRHRGQ